MANVSNGLENAYFGNVGFRGALTNFVVRVYTGSLPTDANQAPTGTLVAEFTLNGDGSTPLNFLAPVGGVLAKDPSVIWRATGLAVGTGGYARFCLPADVGGVSTTAYRVDVTVAISGAELNLNSLTFSVGSPHTIDTYQFS